MSTHPAECQVEDCGCVYYESDSEEDSDACECGHAVEEHMDPA